MWPAMDARPRPRPRRKCEPGALYRGARAVLLLHSGATLRDCFIYGRGGEVGERARARLKSLSFPDDRTRNASMGYGLSTALPALEQLRITKSDQPRNTEPGSDWVDVHGVAGRALQYATQFPRLRSLALAGHLGNYQVDEIFPECEADACVPAPSVRALGAIPLGVDRDLMRRVTRQFPCLTSIRTSIPYEYEELLISVWEGCPKLTGLFLTLGSDIEDSTAHGHVIGTPKPVRRSLDSIFTGFPERECCGLRRRSRSPSAKERQSLPWWRLRAGTPSVCDLKRLRS